MEPSKESGKALMIGGINIKFPCKPYPSQLSMMSKIIKGLNSKSHCLLESPTGSGKTLALLCSTLAWQEEIQKKIQQDALSHSTENLCKSTAHSVDNNSICSKSEICTKTPTEIKAPTIWFGTRTHKQISQITHELARTAYKHVNMTILSSREHSCIHPINEKSHSKNDGCQDLLKGRHPDLLGSQCAFYQNVHSMRTHGSLHSCNLTSAWDLEDLINLGRKLRACPYYSARELKHEASIIFCPYNYLIDRGIRSQMGINVSGQVIIFDEAHNIEDSAREAASDTVNEIELMNTVADLDHLIADGIKTEQHQQLHRLCTKIGHWLQECSANLVETEKETWTKVWSGREFIVCLTEWGVTANSLRILQNCFKEAVDNDNNSEDKKGQKLLHSASQELLGGLFYVLSNLLFVGQKFSDDYRVVVIRKTEYGVPSQKRTRNGWVTVNNRASKYFSINLHFWCLNPTVAFSDLSSSHSIILTSGTLSPMSSFSSELGLPFPIRLEASHVVSDSQVWVGAVGCGPNGQALQAVYQNTNAHNFQDELGHVILSICNIVPFGVLCFFSSYNMIEKLCQRWKSTGLWNEINQKKTIFREPHGKNKSTFERILQAFYECVSNKYDSCQKGAILLAVCRGKVSEGLDFSDNNARAVITVGIPFPNYKDPQVELKRQYNDKHSRDRGLLSGSDWYNVQAFRALNQALGRCIRHKNDWGALIIVDERFCKNPNKYFKGLSKWVRQKVQPHYGFQPVVDSLNLFFQRIESQKCFIGPQACESSSLSNQMDTTSTSDVTFRLSQSNSDFSLSTPENVPSSPNSTVNISKPLPNKINDIVWPKVKNESFRNDLSCSSDDTYLSSFDEFFYTSPKSPNQTIVASKSSTSEEICFSNSDDDLILWDEAAANTNVSMDLEQVVEQSTLMHKPDIGSADAPVALAPDAVSNVIFISDSSEASDVDDVQAVTPSKHKVTTEFKENSTLDQNFTKRMKKSLDYTSLAEQISSRPMKTIGKNNYADESHGFQNLKEDVLQKPQTSEVRKNEIAHAINCLSCSEQLFYIKEITWKHDHNFAYVKTTFPNEHSLIALSELPKHCKLEKTMRTEYGITLDTVWSNVDKVALQFYHCSKCKSPVVFVPLNSRISSQFHVLSSRISVEYLGSRNNEH